MERPARSEEFQPIMIQRERDKELYSILFLFTQVYKWVLVTYCWGVTLRWTSIPSREE